VAGRRGWPIEWRRRALVVGLAAGGLLRAALVRAQPGKVHRIGYLGQPTRALEARAIDALRQGLRELGYVEGRNIAFEYRHADGKLELLPALAAELVAMRVDLIVASGIPPIMAAQRATKTIPIVFPLASDPTGLVASLSRPGGNSTGLTTLNAELSRKRLELLKQIVPGLSRVVVIANSTNPVHTRALEEIKPAAARLGLDVHVVGVQQASDLAQGVRGLKRAKGDALFVLPDRLLSSNRKEIAALAVEQRVPSMFPNAEYVDAGGFVSYGVNVADMFRRAAVYVDKILRGAKPADLPIEQAEKFELVLNRRTARAIGLGLPHSLLVRADRVIE
jgi:putative ABC transport system substrate-binding protein